MTTPTAKRRPPTTVAAPAGEPFDEALALTRRLRLPYLRKALTDVVRAWPAADDPAAGRAGVTLDQHGWVGVT
jgi:hypothetical protein